MHSVRPEALVLETERLRMTPLTVADVALEQALLCDPEVMRFVDDAMEPEAVERDIASFTRRGAGGRIGIWAVARRDTGQKIAHCMMMPVPIEEESYDWSAILPDRFPEGPIEIGYLLVPDAWGQGFASEICARIVRFGFEQADLPEIVATTDVDNRNSQHVLQKCGLRTLGLKRAYAYDEVNWFKITRNEWVARQMGGDPPKMKPTRWARG